MPPTAERTPDSKIPAPEPISLANVADGTVDASFREAVDKAVEDLFRTDLAPKAGCVITVKIRFDLIGDRAVVASHAGTSYTPPKRKQVGRMVHVEGGSVFVDPLETDEAGNRRLPFELTVR